MNVQDPKGKIEEATGHQSFSVDALFEELLVSEPEADVLDHAMIQTLSRLGQAPQADPAPPQPSPDAGPSQMNPSPASDFSRELASLDSGIAEPPPAQTIELTGSADIVAAHGRKEIPAPLQSDPFQSNRAPETAVTAIVDTAGLSEPALLFEQATLDPLEPAQQLPEPVGLEGLAALAMPEPQHFEALVAGELAVIERLDSALVSAAQSQPEVVSGISPEAPAQSQENPGLPLDRVLAVIDSTLGETDAQAMARPEQADPAAEESHTCVVFKLSGSAYGIKIGSVLEMDTVPRITPLPNVPDFVTGVTNLRGEVLPVLNLGSMLGLPVREQVDRGRILMVRTSKGDQTAVLLVDEVRGTTSISFRGLEKPKAQLADPIVPLLFGVGAYQEHVLNVLDLDKLFEVPAVRDLRN